MSKILVVDDEVEVLELLKMILKKSGYEVVGINNPEEVLQRVKKEHPDLIFMDIMMPEINGWELCKAVKEDEETKDIPVVIFSVLSSAEEIEKSRTYAHADAHIMKPGGVDEIREVVKRYME